jgi:hypothetical protein
MNRIVNCGHIIAGLSMDTRKEVKERSVLTKVAREASRNARKDALNNGRSITTLQGDSVVKVHPDGRTDIIRKIEKSSVIPEKRKYQLQNI